MPEKYREVLTGSSAWLALFAAAGGCLVNYLTEYKQTGKLNIRWMLADLATSGFVGFLAFWFLLDKGFTLSECAIATCIVGNLGSKIFDIVRFIISAKLRMPMQLTDTNSKNEDRKL